MIRETSSALFNPEVLMADKFMCSVCGEEKYLLKKNNMPNSFIPTIGEKPGQVCCMECAPTLKKICPTCKIGYTPLDENGVSNFALGSEEKSRKCLKCDKTKKSQFARKVGF